MSRYLEPSHIFSKDDWTEGTDYFKKLSHKNVRYKILQRVWGGVDFWPV